MVGLGVIGVVITWLLAFSADLDNVETILYVGNGISILLIILGALIDPDDLKIKSDRLKEDLDDLTVYQNGTSVEKAMYSQLKRNGEQNETISKE